MAMNTVKRLIICEDLFGEIGEFTKLAKMLVVVTYNKNIPVFRYSIVGNRQINSSPNSHI